jgi:hypothetical protein
MTDELVKRLDSWSKRLGGDDDLDEAAELIAAHAAEVARLEHALLTERGKLERADELAQGLMAERDALREALDGYGAHHDECHRRPGQPDCSCGFRAIYRAALAPAEPKEGTP